MRLLAFLLASSSAFLRPAARRASTARAVATMPLTDPKTRVGDYDGRLAQYLVDLHDNKATFDFCGGMLFQLVLSDALRSRLLEAAEQPEVYDAATNRMAKMPGYAKNADADNVRLFHGREVRKVPNAAGGMNFVLQLSAVDDKDGWVAGERDGYDGWGHDSSRVWRDGKRLEDEGVAGFRERYGPNSFTLNHRFYLHLDNTNQLWLSAEDGCEGRLVDPGEKKKLFGLF